MASVSLKVLTGAFNVAIVIENTQALMVYAVCGENWHAAKDL